MVNEYGRSEGDRKLSDHFVAREFFCKCNRCQKMLIDSDLVALVQKIRDHFGVPVNINSGYRCETHNEKVGGSATSHHMRGMAADIRVEGITPREVAQYAEKIGIQRIGLYEGSTEGNFVHIGSDGRKRFWLGHAGVNVDTFSPPAKTISVTLPVLKKGAKGGAVWGLQALLIGYGYDLGKRGLDGSFGVATDAAVRKYQHEQDLAVDGSVGRNTWETLLGCEPNL